MHAHRNSPQVQLMDGIRQAPDDRGMRRKVDLIAELWCTKATVFFLTPFTPITRTHVIWTHIYKKHMQPLAQQSTAEPYYCSYFQGPRWLNASQTKGHEAAAGPRCRRGVDSSFMNIEKRVLDKAARLEATLTKRRVNRKPRQLPRRALPRDARLRKT